MIEEAPPQSNWDDVPARWLIGKYALLGLTRQEADSETIISQEQVHGIFTNSDASDSIRMVSRGGDVERTVKLPPDIRGLADAKPGHCRPHSTGEVVDDPDVTLSWVLERAPSNLCRGNTCPTTSS